MRFLNTRHVSSRTCGDGDLIFSRLTFLVEHEWALLDSLQPCCPVILQLDLLLHYYMTT